MRWKNLLHPDIWVGLLVLLLLSLPFALSNLDLSLSAFFFHQGWPIGDRQPWYFLYHFGTIPGLLAGIGGLAVLIGGWIRPGLLRWQRPAAVLVLTLLLGPGLLVNTVGKGYWGRQRPRDVTQFNGTETYCRFIHPGTPGQGKSFPCGHASAGYVLVAFYFLDASKKRRGLWLGLGLAFGTLIGIGRMAQGGHFASDVLWAGGLTYLSAALSHHVILPARLEVLGPGKSSRMRFWLAWVLLPLSLAGLTSFFLVATPFHQVWDAEINPPGPMATLQLAWPPNCGKVSVKRASQTALLKVHAEYQGFGFPGVKIQGHVDAEQRGNTVNAVLRLKLDRPVSEQKSNVSIIVRDGLTLRLAPQAQR